MMLNKTQIKTWRQLTFNSLGYMTGGILVFVDGVIPRMIRQIKMEACSSSLRYVWRVK